MSFTPGLATEEMMELAGLAKDRKPEPLEIEFSIEPVENAEKTKTQGRYVADYVEMVRIRVPGETDFRKQVVDGDIKRRFPHQYLAFRTNGSQEVASGTPLSDWPQVSPAQMQEARHMGCVTVEQLAEATDGAMKAFGPGWITLRQKARDWLNTADDGALLAKMRDELAERDARLKTLEEMLAAQSQELKRMGSGPSVATAAVVPDIQAMIAAGIARALAGQQPSQVPSENPPKRRGRASKPPTA